MIIFYIKQYLISFSLKNYLNYHFFLSLQHLPIFLNEANGSARFHVMLEKLQLVKNW